MYQKIHRGNLNQALCTIKNEFLLIFIKFWSKTQFFGEKNDHLGDYRLFFYTLKMNKIWFPTYNKYQTFLGFKYLPEFYRCFKNSILNRIICYPCPFYSPHPTSARVGKSLKIAPSHHPKNSEKGCAT